MEKRIALVGIILEDAGQAESINTILHGYGDYIIGRMGIPYRERGVHIISVAMDAPTPAVSAMTGKLGNLPGVSVKTVYKKQKEN